MIAVICGGVRVLCVHAPDGRTAVGRLRYRAGRAVWAETWTSADRWIAARRAGAR